MPKVRTLIAAYTRELQRLVEALDASVDAQHVQQLSEQAGASFSALSAALDACDASVRAQFEAELSLARFWAALACARCASQRSGVDERLGDVQRARQALLLHAGTDTGGSCDVAG